MATSALRFPSRVPVASGRGFTLVEMLVAITILVVLMVALFSVSAGVANVWKSSTGRVSAFQNARSAFSTLTATLSRATLNPYLDYVNTAGDFRTNTNATSFVPTKFARASELHFLSGPTVDIANAPGAANGVAMSISATADTNPGHGVFFQAPLGYTDPPPNNSTATDYRLLNRAMNSVGFYVQYGPPDTDLLPDWLSAAIGAKNHRFRLVQFMEPTEKLQVYTSTAGGNYKLDWLSFAGPASPQKPRTRVLAEDVLLLVLRPRASPTDEATLYKTESGSTYNQATQFGSILCPNYHYDSRAWQSGYPATRVKAAQYGTDRAGFMKNQLPPIIDVALVCADAQSLARFDATSATPPMQVKVDPMLFADSSKMEADLTTYTTQLSKYGIRYHIQRAAIGIQGAKWSNN